VSDDRWKQRCSVCAGTGLKETPTGYQPCDCPNGEWAWKYCRPLFSVRRIRKDALQKAVPQKPQIPPVDPEEDRLRRIRNQTDLEDLLRRRTNHDPS
jgi:hypothetical protein